MQTIEMRRRCTWRLALVVGTFALQSQAAEPLPHLTVSGDFRLRAQGDFSAADTPDRGSGQVRARLAASYAVSPWIKVGARLATGDADDPNSTDVQLSNFDDKFDVNLDQAWVELDLGNLRVLGGKTPQLLTRTELVWDGDVNPQGIGAAYRRTLTHGSSIRMNGLFFVIDEQAAGPESTMAGAQLGFDSGWRGLWKFDSAMAYYDYSLRDLADADSGDFRTNLLTPDGKYLSDFDLADVIVSTTWRGLGERRPVSVTADYVKNFGAETDADTGYSVELALGRTSAPHDWRVSYGYGVAEADAVLAAFSSDNTSIGTNYRQHFLTFDYVLLPGTQINASWYHYRPDEARYAGARLPGDWLDRVRLAIAVSF